MIASIPGSKGPRPSTLGINRWYFPRNLGIPRPERGLLRRVAALWSAVREQRFRARTAYLTRTKAPLARRSPEHAFGGQGISVRVRVFGASTIWIAALLLSLPLAATTPIPAGMNAASVGNITAFGDILVRAEQTGGGTVTHGYSEYRFGVENHGDTQHTVEIVAPSIRFNLTPGSVSKMSRSVVLAPGTSAVLSIYQPPLVVSGHSAQVIIDGETREPEVQFAPVYASGPMFRVLGSRAVSDAELRTALELVLRSEEFEIQTAASETAEWSRNWLAFSAYDALVITSTELARTDAEVRTAIDRFNRAGGVLVVLDALPDSDCAGLMALPESLSFCPRGFGVRVTTTSPFTSWTPDDVKTLTDEIRGTQEPLKGWGGATHATRGPDFPVVENLSIPLRGLFIGMILFAITAGPLNIAVLSKMNRRIWIIWTLPATALVTSILVIAFASFSEGWVRAARTEAITWIDPDTREATTIGWTGYYATIAPGDGLRFDTQTELHPFGGSRDNVLEIDWTTGQHLTSGWLSSRVTSTFRVRKSEPHRERLTFRRNGDGMTVSNGMGAPIEEVWVADEGGTVWTAKSIEAGGTRALERSPAAAKGTTGPRHLYRGDWLQANEVARRAPGAFIAPGTWVAFLDGSPFIEDAMSGIRTRKERTLVMSELRFGEAQ